MDPSKLEQSKSNMTKVKVKGGTQVSAEWFLTATAGTAYRTTH